MTKGRLLLLVAQVVWILVTEVHITHTAESETASSQGFLFTGPKQLLAGTNEKFCVSIKSAAHPVATCKLDLIVENTTIASVDHQLNDIKDCFTLSVPVMEETSGQLRWRMQFKDLPDYKVDVQKEVAINQMEMEPLIQTDKAWYTPGQLVRFRILSLNHRLHPILDPISRIWVEDPTGTAVAQWTNVTTAHGIIQQELQLAAEPVQGTWKIKMEKEPNKRRGTSEQEFEVREFVLPRFEVLINPPSSIAYNEEGDKNVQKIPITVCAKYSYGQPVKGTLKANIKVVNKRYFGWYTEEESESSAITFDKSGALDVDSGCYTLKMSGDDFGITVYNETVVKTVSLTATVIEQGTELEANATWSTDVEIRSLTMDMYTWSSSTFKNGLPYYGVLQVKMEGGKSVNGIVVEICAKPDEQQQRRRTKNSGNSTNKTHIEICSLYIADASGFVHFNFFPNETDVINYNLKATVSKSMQNINSRQDSAHLKATESQKPTETPLAETSFSIQSSYSPTNSYLSFVLPPNFPIAVACNSKLPIKLYFTADNKTDKFNLHYLIMSRGDVVHSGVHPVTYHKVDKLYFSNAAIKIEPPATINSNNIGSAEFDLEIKPEFSPKVSILAYYIRADNEVVTATLDLDVTNCFPNPVKFLWSSKRKQPGEKVSLNLKSGAGSVCGYSVVDRSVTFIRPDLQLTESKILSPLTNFHINKYNWPQQVTSDWTYCTPDKITYTEEASDDDQKEGTEDDLRRKRSFIYGGRGQHYVTNSEVRDAMDAFDNSGMVVISDLNIETRTCIKRLVRWMMMTRRKGVLAPKSGVSEEEDFAPMPIAYAAPPSAGLESGTETSYENVVDLTPTVAVRTYFPETWLWDLVNLDSNGELKKTVELPHTISNWVGKALCVSEADGFGMSSSSEIEAFQPFFIEIHLPYSVKRTEKLKLKVSVFNYANQALPVRLTLGRSETIQIVGDEKKENDNSAQMCIPAQSNLVHYFIVYSTELGRHNVTVTAAIDDAYPGECGASSALYTGASDTVVKELLVQPEGFPVERLYSQMACPKDFDEDKSLIWDLSLPSDLVEGSARAWVTAVGDLMGPALQGLTGLVRMPTGCGEQNMVLFTPIIYVVRYLSTTNQLDDAIKKKSVDFMKTGYQRELTYRHDDGSYSAFGKSDPEGSLWLTAFVVKSFAAARRYIHVDENDLKTSVHWLLSKQQANGCFPTIGTVLHHDLKGGLSGNQNTSSPLTAFTLISLLEAMEITQKQNSSTDLLATSSSDGSTDSEPTLVLGNESIDKTFSCLSLGEDGSEADFYTTALTAYALVLANRTDEARKKINWMMSHAQRNNSLIWWQKTGSGPALSVEMTAYALLSLVKLGNKNDMTNARSIVRWLSKQRNSEGGFISTQDTVVGLQAIAAYAEAVGTQPIDMKVLITAGAFSHSLQIKESDRLVQRRIDLPLPLAPTVEIDSVGEGSGCAVLQSTLRYNVHKPPPSGAFQLNVSHYELTEGSCSRGRHIKICARYDSSSADAVDASTASNMVLVELYLTSGYEANKKSLEALVREQKTTSVKRFELKDNKVVFYFNEMESKKDYCVPVEFQQFFEVNDAKDANVKIYDYYQPERVQSVSYNLPQMIGQGCDDP